MGIDSLDIMELEPQKNSSKKSKKKSEKSSVRGLYNNY